MLFLLRHYSYSIGKENYMQNLNDKRVHKYFWETTLFNVPFKLLTNL